VTAGARPTLREHLAARPFHLALSSGFFGFFAHAGLMLTLEDAGLLPASLSGASAGALVAGTWAAGLDAQGLADALLRIRRDDFWDPAPGLGLLAGRKFRRELRAILPRRDFAETRAPLSIAVFDVFARRSHALVRGDLADAIAASCAVPAMFHPVWIAGRPYLDGGLRDRPGLTGVGGDRPIFFHHLPSSTGIAARSAVPQREGMTSLWIDGLPAVGPFRLERGRAALEHAAKRARIALERPLDGALVAV
jgi:NTE family protein